ncbi:MAG: DUF3858 domain-containing protein [Cyclobacteriaceae bacterium]
MKYRLNLFLFFFTGLSSFAQDYPAEILNYDIECIINKDEKLTIKKSLLLKINSISGRENADMELYFNYKSSIKSFALKILDKNQKLIKKFRKKEIQDYSVLTGYLYTGDRYMDIKAFHNDYPYIVNLEFTQEYDGYFSIPTWYPQNGENIPSRKSSFKLTVPLNYSFRHKIYNFEPIEDVQTDESSITYFWQIENLSPIFVQEAYVPPIKNIYPMARFVPDHFKFGGLKGTSKTWKDLGNWQSKFIEGLDNLPENEIENVKNLTKDTNLPYEKVKILYEYLQNETRYVGVFIGIGGWKPYDAEYVCSNKYGDCKALTNYMKAMLKAIGIQSYYALIVAGKSEPDIDTSFASMNFNHAVLCVPLANDTLWLECTSENIPFNYWGTFTSGKHALVCNYKQSFITQTPQFNYHENSVNQTSKVSLIDGKLEVDMHRELYGESFEEVNNNLAYNPDKNIKDIAVNTIPFENYKINDIKYKKIIKKGCVGYKESLGLTFSNNVQQYGSNVIISPFNNYLKTTHHLNTKRRNPISILYNFTLNDTIQFIIPDGYEVESIPVNFKISTKFGMCVIVYTKQNAKLRISKQILLNKGIYASRDYPEFKSFITSIINNENKKILLKKL